MSNFSFRQQVFAGFAVSIVLVLAVGLLSYRSIHQSKEDAALVARTQKIIRNSDQLLQSMIDAETGVRGFIATGNKVFLDPYNNAIPQISTNLSDLHTLVLDNAQSRRIDTLSKIVGSQLSTLKDDVDTRETKGLDYIIKNDLLLNGKHNMDYIRALIAEINGTENRLLTQRQQNSDSSSDQAIVIIITGSTVFLIIIIFLFFYIQEVFEREKKAKNEIGITNIQLEEVLAENEEKNWMLTGLRTLNERMQGEQTEKELTKNIIAELCNYTRAVTGTFYLFDEHTEQLEYSASYAFHNLDALKRSVKLSEGLIGQVGEAEKPIVIKGKLNEKLGLESSLLRDVLTETFIFPVLFNRKLKGVIEIAFQDELKTTIQDYILAASDVIGIAVNTAQARSIMQHLFEETQQQAEELTSQQEEMRVTNEELVSKTEQLQASEEELRVQQEELRSINAELEEKASLLEERNQAVEEARQAIKLKMEELETTGKYKSEFLANMSHELRTPLNSILVLARILKDNNTTNLTEDQIKYASVIFNAGNDLLTLINDILDLSKIESGKMEMQNEEILVSDIVRDMEQLFAETAQNKQIKYSTNYSKAPKLVYTDKVRVEQVMKNLLSNAFKFTPEQGSISITVTEGNAADTISFSIKDMGIGIAEDKQQTIFEAFQQADGSTSRKYGGTGLGLSISRELATLLGGAITLKSKPNEGSEFTLTIPVKATENPKVDVDELMTVDSFTPPQQFLAAAIQQPRPDGQEPLVVIVEDDKNFAVILQNYARDHGFKSILVNDGNNAVGVITENLPDAVILDIKLPGKDGWQILKELKLAEKTAPIPVHMMSAGDVEANRLRKEGAISFIKKPIDTGAVEKLFKDMSHQSGVEFKQILLAEDHEAQSHALKALLEERGITVDQAFDGESAFKMLNENNYQCVILDLNLPDISGLDLLDRIKKIERFASLPVIVNTAMELDKTSVNRLMQYANAMVVKTNKSSGRLIDEVNLFLNKISSGSVQQATFGANVPVKAVAGSKDILKGKKVLVVDDDMRNIFALSSALKTYGLVVETAGDGEEAIEKLESTDDISLVLMDIMMPKMDGYEATKYIRKQNKTNGPNCQ